MSRGGSENATGALAVHDSPAAPVIVSLGAGGPGIGRRAARPPRTKNRGIRRTRDDARRGTPSRATGPRWYRADQREMPRRAACKSDSGLRTGRSEERRVGKGRRRREEREECAGEWGREREWQSIVCVQ